MKPLFSYFLTEPDTVLHVMVPAEIKRRVDTRVQTCLNDATEHFGRSFDFPLMKYSLMTTDSGQANYSYWSINLNPILLIENVEEYLNSTIPHEVAHLLHDKLNYWTIIKRIIGMEFEAHNHKWEEIMLIVGATPRIYHHYDISSMINIGNS